MNKIRVDLGKRSYDILVGQNILGNIGEFVKAYNVGRDAFIITNSEVGGLYGEKIKNSLHGSGIKVKSILLPEGEKEKNIENWKMLLEELVKFDGLEKRIFIIALGGGVIGDLAGFVAACYRRGINYVQIPTTLLAQVDSGVGGKVGVDFLNVKNLIGTFYQPTMVYADLKVLETLSWQELKSGLAEIIKYGVVYDNSLFELLEKNISKIKNFDLDLMEKIVLRCYKIKAEIVSKDELDTSGLRAILNFGHTIGHAIEGSSQYFYKHGEAISVGMLCAAEIGVGLNYCSKTILERIERLLKEFGLPTKILKGNVAEIIKIMAHDKKFITGKTRLILPQRIGKVFVKEGIDIKLIRKIVKRKME